MATRALGLPFLGFILNNIAAVIEGKRGAGSFVVETRRKTSPSTIAVSRQSKLRLNRGAKKILFIVAPCRCFDRFRMKQPWEGFPVRAALALFTFLLVAPNGAVGQTSAGDGTLSLTDLVREVKVALLQVEEAAERQDLPKLESAVLEVKTSLKLEGDGKISMWVVELGGGQNNEYASTVTLTLKPPPPGSSSNIAAVHLADALREAIISGARAIKAAGQGNPPLVADKLEASVHFAVERDASGKVSIKFPPFEASGGGGVKSGAVQTISVTYKK
jgi:hypothetical protein